MSIPPECDDPLTDEFGFPRLSGWMNRAFAAMAADLRWVDCGSLDVLLYCADDLAAGTPGDSGVAGSAQLT